MQSLCVSMCMTWMHVWKGNAFSHVFHGRSCISTGWVKTGVCVHRTSLSQTSISSFFTESALVFPPKTSVTVTGRRNWYTYQTWVTCRTFTAQSDSRTDHPQSSPAPPLTSHFPPQPKGRTDALGVSTLCCAANFQIKNAVSGLIFITSKNEGYTSLLMGREQIQHFNIVCFDCFGALVLWGYYFQGQWGFFLFFFIFPGDVGRTLISRTVSKRSPLAQFEWMRMGRWEMAC